MKTITLKVGVVEMKQNAVGQIHIIPFDLGCVFFDCLSIDNSKNLCFADYFVDKLSMECANLEVSIEKNFQLKKTWENYYRDKI